MAIRSSSLFSLLALGILGITSMISLAQEQDDERESTAEEQMLEDFGSGLKAVGWTLEDPDINFREIYGAAADALFPDKSDEGMAIYLEDYEANQQQEELDAFGGELKDAVMNGSISREDALSTWMTVMDESGKGQETEDGKENDWSDRLENAARNGRMASIHLRIPDGGDVRVLTRPEFLRRDLQYFGRELRLDEATRSIIELLLDDYVNTYEQRTEELRSAIRESRGRAGRQWRIREVDRARTMFNDLAGSIDWDRARSRVAERIGDGEKQAGMIAAIDRFAETLPNVQQAIEQRHASLDRTIESAPEGPDVLRLAANLQAERPRMRAELIESIRLVLDDRQKEALEAIFDQFILEQGRLDSKLGGSRIDLEGALELSLEDRPMDDGTRETLEEATGEVLQLVDQWTNARIDRERSGLELFVAYERSGEPGAERMARNHAQRATSELNAAIAIRDRLLAAQSEIETVLAGSDQEVARRFVATTREQGFAPQMRTRWSERALASALACADLDEDARDVLIEYESAVSEQLEPIRMQAILDRMDVEPRIAREKIRDITDEAGDSLGLAGWREPGVDRFEVLDDQVDMQLDSLLQGLACAESLPRRPGAIEPKAPEDAKGKGDGGKGSGKGAGGKGASGGKNGGSGRSGGKAGGKQ